MEMIRALKLVHDKHPYYNPLRVEEVICALLDCQSIPTMNAILPFDSEKCPIEESVHFLLNNPEMHSLCAQEFKTPIREKSLRKIFRGVA